MAQVVGGLCVSHAPGWLGWPEAPPLEQRNAVANAAKRVAQYIDDIRPQVIIAILDDHFENHYRSLMPTFSIGIADNNSGPADYWLEALRLKEKQTVPGMPELANSILTHMIHSGFDLARLGAVEYGNNLAVPWQYLRPQNDLPIIPVFINVFSPPLTPVSRAYQFGEALRRAVEAAPQSQRVAFMATGGLSHWPPFWMEHHREQPEFLERMRRYQEEGRPVLDKDPNLMVDLGAFEIAMARTSNRPLVNTQWDRDFLAALGKGDINYMRNLTYAGVEANGGHGGHEILNWVAVMGAMKGQPAEIVGYEAVIEWICGMAFAVYPHQRAN
jgi:2,3-dihydroxyphenylpropionate 1,2-dioxygenase